MSSSQSRNRFFKMCRFPSVGSVDLRLAPLITFACGCHRSEKAASAHPTRKNAKSRLVEGSSRQTLVPTFLWSENHYLYALSYLAHFFLPSLNQFTWLILRDFSTLFSACKIDIPTTEATSVQFHDGNYCQLSCHFNCLLTGLFQNCSQHISTHTKPKEFLRWSIAIFLQWGLANGQNVLSKKYRLEFSSLKSDTFGCK